MAGLGFSVPAAVTGLADYSTIPQGHPGESTATWHMMANFTAVLLFAGGLAAMGNLAPPERARKWAAVALTALGFLVLAAGGWLGGHLVFHHLIGTGAEEREPAEPRQGG